ncbi:MAG: hypothetical protein ACK56Z_18520 [Pseudanabaena sp.]
MLRALRARNTITKKITLQHYQKCYGSPKLRYIWLRLSSAKLDTPRTEVTGIPDSARQLTR